MSNKLRKKVKPVTGVGPVENHLLMAAKQQVREDQIVDAAYVVQTILTMSILREKFGFGGMALNQYVYEFKKLINEHNNGVINLSEREKLLNEIGISVLKERSK